MRVEILLKVALNTINQTKPFYSSTEPCCYFIHRFHDTVVLQSIQTLASL
jgi:hypothetical protein